MHVVADQVPRMSCACELCARSAARVASRSCFADVVVCWSTATCKHEHQRTRGRQDGMLNTENHSTHVQYGWVSKD